MHGIARRRRVGTACSSSLALCLMLTGCVGPQEREQTAPAVAGSPSGSPLKPVSSAKELRAVVDDLRRRIADVPTGDAAGTAARMDACRALSELTENLYGRRDEWPTLSINLPDVQALEIAAGDCPTSGSRAINDLTLFDTGPRPSSG